MIKMEVQMKNRIMIKMEALMSKMLIKIDGDANEQDLGSNEKNTDQDGMGAIFDLNANI